MLVRKSLDVAIKETQKAGRSWVSQWAGSASGRGEAGAGSVSGQGRPGAGPLEKFEPNSLTVATA